MQDDIELIRTIHAAIRRARQEGRPRTAQVHQAVETLLAVQPDLSRADALRLVEVVRGGTQGRGAGGWGADPECGMEPN
jgi:hypothetical protein